MNEINSTIGNNIKLIRSKYGMTLDQVSEATGVSKSMIGQIERGTSTPTVTTLWKICNGLKISFSSLLKEDTTESEIINKLSLNSLSEDNTHNLYSFIPFNASRKFEVFNMELLSEAEHYSEPHTGSMEEFIYVLKGEGNIITDDKSYIVKTGDLLRFDANAPHVYRNMISEVLEMMIIIVYQ